jgi:hypothetical protein
MVKQDVDDVCEVNRITVHEDIGGPYPRYKKVTLVFWSDGTVTWEPVDG